MAVVVALATTYLEADAASITFSGIVGTYDHLQVRCSGRTTRATSVESIALRLGDSGDSPVDTGTTYQTHQLYGASSATGSGGETGQARMHLGYFLPTTTVPAEYYGGIVCDILDYADDGGKNTTVTSVTGSAVASASSSYVVVSSGLWDNTAAVTAIQIYPNNGSDFTRGTEVTLYGVKAAN